MSLNRAKPTLEAGAGAPRAAPAAKPDREMLPVEVHEPQPGPIQILRSVLTALLPPLATAAIVVIFVIFILLQRDDLRDRFIGLIGAHDLHRTTKALDDAGTRLSRYFLALTGINAVFGIVISVGLTVIGVPNPILWGIVGAVLRFVPYIGAIISAAFPLALAAAVDPRWSMAAETAALFVGLDMIMGQIVEPQLFGHTTGMSPLAVIVAAAFWTLIWGPAGLLLSTPVTACLVVLGRHVESLNFIELLLGDKPALSPVQSFYQRILASDPDEVAFQAEALLKNISLLDYYEEVALPALAMAQVDVDRQVMDLPRQIEVCAAVEHVVADLSDHVDAQPETVTPIAISPPEPASGVEVLAPESAPRAALCIGGRTPLDQAACAVLVQLLERRGVAARTATPQALTNRGRSRTARGRRRRHLHILSRSPERLAAVRYSVRRLRKRFHADADRRMSLGQRRSSHDEGRRERGCDGRIAPRSGRFLRAAFRGAGLKARRGPESSAARLSIPPPPPARAATPRPAANPQPPAARRAKGSEPRRRRRCGTPRGRLWRPCFGDRPTCR